MCQRARVGERKKREEERLEKNKKRPRAESPQSAFYLSVILQNPFRSVPVDDQDYIGHITMQIDPSGAAAVASNNVDIDIAAADSSHHSCAPVSIRREVFEFGALPVATWLPRLDSPNALPGLLAALLGLASEADRPGGRRESKKFVLMERDEHSIAAATGLNFVFVQAHLFPFSISQTGMVPLAAVADVLGTSLDHVQVRFSE